MAACIWDNDILAAVAEYKKSSPSRRFRVKFGLHLLSFYINYTTRSDVIVLLIRGKRMSTVEARVKKIVIEQLGVKEEEVTNDASFVDDLGADSLDTVELVMALEEEFETEIPDEDAEKITTIQQAIDYINSHMGEHAKE